jgi:hypothetical protein
MGVALRQERNRKYSPMKTRRLHKSQRLRKESALAPSNPRCQHDPTSLKWSDARILFSCIVQNRKSAPVLGHDRRHLLSGCFVALSRGELKILKLLHKKFFLKMTPLGVKTCWKSEKSKKHFPDSEKACVLKRKVAKMQFLRLFASIYKLSLNQGSVFLIFSDSSHVFSPRGIISRKNFRKFFHVSGFPLQFFQIFRNFPIPYCVVAPRLCLTFLNKKILRTNIDTMQMSNTVRCLFQHIHLC